MRILFITSNRIGDAVLSSGLLGHLAALHPAARFTVACGPVAAPLFADMPGLERLIPMVKRKRAGHWRDLWRQTVGTRWSLVVDLRASAFSWLVPTWRRRVFHSSPHEAVHKVVQYGRLLGLAEPPPPGLWVSPARAAEAARLVPDGGPVLAVGPTANWGAKQWRAEHFAAVVERLTGPAGVLAGARVAVFGAAAERAQAAPLIESIPPARRLDLVGGADLLTVYAALARCALYLGNDSGLMHLAAAAGAPTLGLFGPSPELLYAPWGARAAAVRGPRSFIDICHASDYDYRSHATLMDDLTVERVACAAATLYRRCGEDE